MAISDTNFFLFTIQLYPKNQSLGYFLLTYQLLFQPGDYADKIFFSVVNPSTSRSFFSLAMDFDGTSFDAINAHGLAPNICASVYFK